MTETATVIHAPADWFHELDWRSLFGNDHPVEIEIGCGKGRFLMWAAAASPDQGRCEASEPAHEAPA